MQLTCSQCRQADRIAIEDYGIPGIVLMENAGRGCATALMESVDVKASVILCGPGNNGGDGFVIARYLSEAGCRVKVLLAAPVERYRGDALTNLKILCHLPVPIIEIDATWNNDQLERELANVGRDESDCIVDALLGTGTRGAPRAPLDRLIGLANRRSVFRLAVDLPSGMDGDSGQADGAAFRADMTCTFIAHKPGLVTGHHLSGNVKLVDIGLPRGIIARLSVGG